MIDYSKKLNKTVLDLRPSGIREFFDIVASMPDTISLGVGEPDFITPWDIRKSAVESIQNGYTAYTSNLGLLNLREEISKYLKSRFSLKYCPKDEILITVGASEAIDLALRSMVKNGDEVLMPDPSYVSYAPNVLLVGGKPVPIKTTQRDKFKITKKALEKAITSKSRVIIIPFPNNPTGATMTKEELEELAPLIIKHDLLVLSDEIYAELTYEGSHTSIATLKGLKERTVVVSGFSKAFAMTGWRIGYAAGQKEIISAMTKIHQYTIMCAPTVSQYAALEALKSGAKDNFSSVCSMKDSYNIRRRFLVNEFLSMGLECFMPEGAFYVFPSVKCTGLNGLDFSKQLLYSKKVAVVPGSAFGLQGEYHIRTCYATSMQQLQEATKRIKEFIKETKK